MADKDEILLKFAERLSEIRKQKGITMRGLAARAGIEFSLVQRIGKGKVNFEYTTLVKIAEGLDVKPSELIDYF